MTWDLNNDRDVIYRVLPGSYMSTSILAHPLGLKDDGGAVSSAIYKEIAKEYIFSSSADGHTWTQIEITDDDIIPEHGFTEERLDSAPAECAYRFRKDTVITRLLLRLPCLYSLTSLV